MDKLHIDQNKISKCQHCNEDMVWLLRRDNVNNTLSDDDVRKVATNGLGDKMQEWCENCNMYTLQIVVAYDLKPAEEQPND